MHSANDPMIKVFETFGFQPDEVPPLQTRNITIMLSNGKRVDISESKNGELHLNCGAGDFSIKPNAANSIDIKIY